MPVSTVAVIDYGMGNLHSVASALESVADGQHKVVVSDDPAVIRDADRIVFPGVGAIRDCMAELQRTGLGPLVLELVGSRPILAVCVGLQALMTRSEENGGVDCLNLFPGEVEFFGADLKDAEGNRLKVPHMGWNTVTQACAHPLWEGIDDNAFFYFVHSYYVSAGKVRAGEQAVAGRCHYGHEFDAALYGDRLFAAQFHPEKSGDAGLRLLRNFLNWDGQFSK